MFENVLGGRYRSRTSKTLSPSMQPTEEPNDDDCEEYIYISKIECEDYLYDNDKFDNYIGKYKYIGNDDNDYPVYQQCDDDKDDDKDSTDDSKDSKDSKDDYDDKNSKDSDDSDDKDDKDSTDSKDDDDDKDSKDDSDDKDSDDNDNDNNEKAEITLGRRFEELKLKIDFPTIGLFYEPNCYITKHDKDDYAEIRIDEYNPFDGIIKDKWEREDNKMNIDIIATIEDCNKKAFDIY